FGHSQDARLDDQQEPSPGGIRGPRPPWVGLPLVELLWANIAEFNDDLSGPSMLVESRCGRLAQVGHDVPLVEAEDAPLARPFVSDLNNRCPRFFNRWWRACRAVVFAPRRDPSLAG